MLKLIVVAVAVLVVSADAATPCCGPSQFIGGVGCLVGQSATPGSDPLGVNYLQFGAWDFANRKFGYNMDVIFDNGTQSKFSVIQEYATATQWVYIDEYKYCVKGEPPLPEPTICIPDKAVFFGSLYVGGNGTDSLLVDSWTSTSAVGTLNGTASITVRHKDCFPLGSQFQGTSSLSGQAVPTIFSSGWFNITLGIPQPADWFTVPTYCTQQEMNSANQKAHHHHIPSLKRFF